MTLPLHGFQDWQNPLHTADLQTDVNSTNINAGAQFTLPVFDMRFYQSFNLMVSATSNINPPTGFGAVEYFLLWAANAAGTQIIDIERYSFFPQGVGGGFASALGRVMHKGPVKGPYLFVQVGNNGPDQIGVSWRLLGNTKPTTARALINTDINGHVAFDPDSGVVPAIGAVIAGGAAFDGIWPIQPGLLDLTIAGQTVAYTVSFINPNGTTFKIVPIAIGQTLNQLAVLPRCAVRVHIVNNGGVNGFINVLGAVDTQGWK